MITEAAANNASWCASMCRAHDLDTSGDGRVWRSPARTPLYYPDAVTLVPGLEAAEVLDGIDSSPGCSVKDSFADLDLSAHGFEVLFEAEWIGRSSAAPLPAGDALEWRRAGELAEWEAAWSGGEATGLFTPRLLDDPSVLILEGRDDDGIKAGAVLNRGGGAVGVSNVFGDGLAGATRASADLLGATALVGYESGDDLDAALRVGFRSLGPLRVWLRA
ncbi:hypothetical protein AB0I28_36405 [Phytomonospora sp. NPDC050363]|uniref:hypothetical protein n=1 Tax=Phytomonospora sp. NPDC050363 TaxID=3155642 RepID=UPI0033C09425